MTPINSSNPLATFKHALKSRDVDGVAATFIPEATVPLQDEAAGRVSIRDWIAGLLSGDGHLRLINVYRRTDKTEMTLWSRASAADDVVQLDLTFTIDKGRFDFIRYQTATVNGPPPPVGHFIRGVNFGDVDGILDAFAEDALVNDQLRDHWGIEAIRDWALSDIIGEDVTMHIVKVVRHYGHYIVTAHMDGSYDKRGLPDPLVMAFYFSACGSKIVQLIILRTQP